MLEKSYILSGEHRRIGICIKSFRFGRCNKAINIIFNNRWTQVLRNSSLVIGLAFDFRAPLLQISFGRNWQMTFLDVEAD